MPAIKSPTLQAKRKPFAEVLAQLDAGQEATDQMNDLVHACTQTGKSGSLTITVKVKAIGTTGQVEIDTDVKSKAPTEVRAKTLMFATADNNLQRENPKQKSLEGIRDADQEAEARSAARSVEEVSPPRELRAV